MSGQKLRAAFAPAEPLRKRVPQVDSDGTPLADFMMLIPGLKARPAAVVEATVQELERVLAEFCHSVVFVDLNLRLNLLWISVRPSPGICMTVAAAVQDRVPEAVLVASPFVPAGGGGRRTSARRLFHGRNPS